MHSELLTHLFKKIPVLKIDEYYAKKQADIPIIFDPSHIAGNRHLIQALTQKALLLDVDGLMIETHCNPEMALSDKEQQLPVSGYQHLLQTLTFPQ